MKKGKGKLTYGQLVRCNQQLLIHNIEVNRKNRNLINEMNTYKVELQKLQKELKSRA